MALGDTLTSNINDYQESSWGGGGGKVRSARQVGKRAAIYEPIVEKMWDLRHLTNL
jgi:hypothetical protein